MRIISNRLFFQQKIIVQSKLETNRPTTPEQTTVKNLNNTRSVDEVSRIEVKNYSSLVTFFLDFTLK